MKQNLIQNIWAVGRNYLDHATEMNTKPPAEPMIFLKSGNCINTSSKIQLPEWSQDVQHEIELAYWVDENLGLSHITLALDLTARDVQNKAKSSGTPWTMAKSFTGACPLAPWISLNEIKSIDSLSFQLKKNHQVAQSGQTKDMLFKPEVLLSYIKKHFPIGTHDVILSGTPAGVASLKKGDSLEAILQSEDRTIFTCLWDVE